MIGVFDSGMGGLSVWREIKKLMPEESLLYFGDGLHCPYGDKPADEVLKYIDNAVTQLIEGGVKTVVLACNTATVIAAKYLRDKYTLPIIGMEPAIKPAVETTRTGIVGVLATHGTIHSDWFREKICSCQNRVDIITVVGEGWVEAVEMGMKIDVRPVIEPLIDNGVDRIVLGCTHYPFLKADIEAVAGDRATIIDPSPAVARRVEWIIDENQLRAPYGEAVQYEFLTAWDNQYRERLIHMAHSCLE